MRTVIANVRPVGPAPLASVRSNVNWSLSGVSAVYASSQVVLLVLFALIYLVLLVSPAGILGKGEWAS